MNNIKIALLVKELRRLNGLIFPIRQSGEAIWWRVCYQRGLPHLVYNQLPQFNIFFSNTPCERYISIMVLLHAHLKI